MRQDARIKTRNARAMLKQRSEPYWCNVSKGLAVGYFKGATGGTWIARHFSVGTGRRKASIGVADDFMDADGRTVLSFAQAQVAAQNWLTKKNAEDTGEVIAGSYTVAQAMADYVANLERVKRKSQYRTSALIKAHILPTLGHIELAKLRHGKVRAWLTALSETTPRVRTRVGKAQAFRTIDADSPDAMRKRQATANRILSVLKAALNYAAKETHITTDAAWKDVSPFERVDVPKVRFLTADEVTALVANCGPDFQLLVKGALLTGCRYGELCRMTAADFKDGKVYIAQSKNGESRYVDLNDAGIEFFAELGEGRKPKEKLFLKANGIQWQTSEQFRPMNAACEAAKVEGVTFHILRHTYASHALMAGMTIEVLAQQLGHKDTRITMRHYAHLCPTFKQESIRRYAPSFGFGSAPEPSEAESPSMSASGRRTAKILPIASGY
jgi:integrase